MVEVLGCIWMGHLRENRFQKLGVEECKLHRGNFNNNKDRLIKEWEKNTGQIWPKYKQDLMSKNGMTVVRRAGNLYDAHHIIESGFVAKFSLNT